MRILINAAQHAIGGALTHLEEVLPRLAAIDPADRYLVLMAKGAAARLDLPANVELTEVPVPFTGALEYGLRLAWENAALPIIARRFGADVIFYPLPSTALWGARKSVGLFQNAAPFDRAWSDSVPLGARLRGALLGRLITAQSARMAVTVCISEHGRALLSRSVRGFDAHTPIVPHGVDVVLDGGAAAEAARKRWNLERPFVLLVSHLYRYKQVLEAAEGFARWVVPRCDADLVVAGSEIGSESDYAAALKEVATQSAGHIRLLGAVPRADLSGLYSAAAAFVFPSRTENCPNILLEALAHGCAIACADVPPMREFAGEAALYFDPRDPHGAGLAMRSLLLDERLAAGLRARARERAQRYRWEEAARRTHTVLTAVAQRATPNL